MAAIITPGHYIRAKYHGPTEARVARYSLTWEGWPSDGGRRVRKTVDWMEPRDLAARAADLFAAWLADDEPGSFTVAAVEYASAGPDEWAIIAHCDRLPA